MSCSGLFMNTLSGTHLHTYIPVHTHLHTHTHTWTHIPAHIPVHIPAHTHLHILTCTHIHTYVHIHTCTHTCIYLCTHTTHTHSLTNSLKTTKSLPVYTCFRNSARPIQKRHALFFETIFFFPATVHWTTDLPLPFLSYCCCSPTTLLLHQHQEFNMLSLWCIAGVIGR